MQDQHLVYNEILEVVTRFYVKATQDFLIGYHFRNIDNFETHIPRIASFWELQLTGVLTEKKELPFNLIKAHLPLKIKYGELGRWVLLFNEVLEQSNLLHISKTDWIEKIDTFKEKLLKHPTVIHGSP